MTVETLWQCMYMCRKDLLSVCGYLIRLSQYWRIIVKEVDDCRAVSFLGNRKHH